MIISAADAFRKVAAAQPDALALTTARVTYTYADLDRWSDAIASDIVARGASPEHPIAIVTADNVALVPSILAAVKAGHFFVMIDAADPDDRIALILRESGARLCVVDSVDNPPAAVRAHDLVGSRSAVAEPPLWNQSGGSAAALLDPHPFVYVVYTSGTTGKPKAILTRHEGFVEKTLASAAQVGRRPGARSMYSALPGFTRAAGNVFSSLLGGATMCAFDARNESLDALAEFIVRERISVLTLTPSLFRRLMIAAPPNLDLSHVKRLRVGADTITIADVEAFRKRFPRGCAFETGFASTETGSVFRMRIDHDTPIAGPLVPMGRPNDGVDVRLVDDDGNDAAIGETGEIVVTSEDVVDGYWNDPELTAQRFAADPSRPNVRTFFTGDLAKRDENGLYYFVGRKDARLKIHGRRIDPTEVEAAILATGEVREAVITGKPDAHGTMRLVAYVVMRDGKRCDPRALRVALRKSHPLWMVPARIYEIDAIPFTRAGKVDRSALVARADVPHDEESGAADDLERKLVEVWSSVIGTPVHVDDDFFDDLGGESIIAAHLVTEVQRVTGRAIALSLLLELNTIAKMADYLRADVPAEQIAVLVQAGGALPPLFCVSGGGGSVMVYRKLAALLGSEQPFYGLQHHGFAAGTFPTSYAAIAACYADTIRKIQPEGPYFLAGYSIGGQLAFEVARQMEHAGDRVAFLGLIDSSASEMRAPVWNRILNRIVMLRRHPVAHGVRFTKEVFNRFIVPSLKAYSESRKDFTLQPYGGAVTLFRARNGMGAARVEPDLGWNRVGVGSLQVFDVDGDHETLLSEDVASLGNAFAGALTAARKAN